MIKLLKILRFPDPADPTGGTPSPAPSSPPSDPKEKANSPPLDPKPIDPKAAPPITAKAVLEGTKTERELELERKLTERERRLAELEDQNRTLQTPAKPKGGDPAPQKKSWLSGGTFFED